MIAVTETTLTSTRDGFTFPALSARARGHRRGGVVVIQEIFGLSAHVREMCAFFADAGYDVLAPSLFARVERDFSAELTEAGFAKGRAAVAATPWPQAIADVQDAIDSLPRPTFITGFCYGGTIAWLAAARCACLNAAAGFYGRLIVDFLDEPPLVPTMLHYGARDASIPQSDIDRVRAVAPGAPIHIYHAGHGFCRRASKDYDAPACDLALARTLDWFEQHRS